MAAESDRRASRCGICGCVFTKLRACAGYSSSACGDSQPWLVRSALWLSVRRAVGS